MKSAYELAMERLNKSQPTAKTTAAQKEALAELDSKYAAKIAEREIFLKGEMGKAIAKGEFGEAAELEQQLTNHRKSMRSELEEKKESVRTRASTK